jgi:hypothetical protein
MTRLSVLLLVLAAAEACATRAGGFPAASGTGTLIAAAPVSAIDTTQPATADAVRRANEAAAAVDTIVVRPDTLTLHVGQVIAPWTAITIEARNAAGDLVRSFAPMMRIEDRSVVEFSPAGLVGRKVGRTQFVISPVSLDPSKPARAVRAVVVLQVLP